MTTEQLIAEITSGGFTQYDEAGLIDYISLRRWIKNELKRFGSNIMLLSEYFFHVDNYKAKLPDNFWQLYLAVSCTMDGYTTEDDEAVLQNSLFFQERIEGVMEWDNTSESYSQKDFKYIKEDFYFNKASAVFHYNDIQLLKLTKGFNKASCSSDCKNIREVLSTTNPNEINIIGETLNTNFKSGTIYMQYYGLPADKNGALLIPETQHNRLQEYLIYYCRMRILEDIVMGDDDPAKANMLNYLNQKQRDALIVALTETKMEALGKNWMSRVRNKTRLQTLKYDNMLPKR